MHEIVLYELDKPVTARTFAGKSGAEGRPVRQVHAAPAAPGTTSTPGPRTLCGKDTFDMEAATWKPSEHPGSSWYTPKYADRVCSACDSAMNDS
ncbi:hypothetical protein [Streptomyces sp. 7N604]|uniref:hypothetical protein n=1 Tax=Streptomyces sp. 7N604 TaxID=3457415 RepID=UPI003FD1F195